MFDVADTVHVSVDVDITVFSFQVATGSVEVTLMRECFSIGQGSSHT